MGLFSSAKSDLSKWRSLENLEDLENAILLSQGVPVLFFKHSTRCSISSLAFSTFNREWQLSEEKCLIYYLDLLKYREVSNQIEHATGVIHQSPQAILLKEGKVIYAASHGEIDAEHIEKLVV